MGQAVRVAEWRGSGRCGMARKCLPACTNKDAEGKNWASQKETSEFINILAAGPTPAKESQAILGGIPRHSFFQHERARVVGADRLPACVHHSVTDCDGRVPFCLFHSSPVQAVRRWQWRRPHGPRRRLVVCHHGPDRHHVGAETHQICRRYGGLRRCVSTSINVYRSF